MSISNDTVQNAATNSETEYVTTTLPATRWCIWVRSKLWNLSCILELQLNEKDLNRHGDIFRGAETLQMKNAADTIICTRISTKRDFFWCPMFNACTLERETVNIRGLGNSTPRRGRTRKRKRGGQKRTEEDRRGQKMTKGKKQRKGKARCLLGSRRAFNASQQPYTLQD